MKPQHVRPFLGGDDAAVKLAQCPRAISDHSLQPDLNLRQALAEHRLDRITKQFLDHSNLRLCHRNLERRAISPGYRSTIIDPAPEWPARIHRPLGLLLLTT